jgi:hypothetical protein
MRSCSDPGLFVTDLPLLSGLLGPCASGEQPGLAAPDASRVIQVRARARSAGGLSRAS